jgi:hypothetical protein
LAWLALCRMIYAVSMCRWYLVPSVWLCAATKEKGQTLLNAGPWWFLGWWWWLEEVYPLDLYVESCANQVDPHAVSVLVCRVADVGDG